MDSGDLYARWISPAPGELGSIASARLCWAQGRVSEIRADDVACGVDGSASIAEPLPVSRRLIVPALANAHDHARTFRSSTLGGWGRPLESWLPLLSLLPSVDPYLVAASSFARSVRRGATAVMVHYTRVQGRDSPVQEAMAVARAARDVGLRIGFAVSLRDQRPLGYSDDDRVLEALRPGIRDVIRKRLAAPAPDPHAQLERFSAIAKAIEDDASLAPHVTVQLGPTAVQWCSDGLLRAVARLSLDEDRPVHMHLLETRYQREWADQQYPGGLIQHLDDIGLLSPRLTLAHCTWARPDELERLAERGVTIAVNTSSNLHLRSGLAPVRAMREVGCRIAMGLDGMAFDEDDDGLREMRLAGALHRGWGFEADWSDAELWRFASATGRRSVLGAARDQSEPGGALLPGHAADFLVMDLDLLDEDRDLLPGSDPAVALMARGRADAIRCVVVRGRPVVVDGRVIGVDEPAVREALYQQTREAVDADADWQNWRETLEQFHQDLGPFYRQRHFLGCC